MFDKLLDFPCIVILLEQQNKLKVEIIYLTSH